MAVLLLGFEGWFPWLPTTQATFAIIGLTASTVWEAFKGSTISCQRHFFLHHFGRTGDSVHWGFRFSFGIPQIHRIHPDPCEVQSLKRMGQLLGRQPSFGARRVPAWDSARQVGHDQRDGGSSAAVPELRLRENIPSPPKQF